MTTVVYRKGRLLTDTKLTVLKNKDEIEQALNNLLTPEMIELLPNTAHNVRLYKEYAGEDLMLKLPETGGKYIELDKESQFEYSPGNTCKAIAFAGNLVLLPGLTHAIDHGFQYLKYWWEDHVIDAAWLYNNGFTTEEQLGMSFVILMFITEKGAYVWEPFANDDGNRREHFHSADDENCIGIGSGMSCLIDYALGTINSVAVTVKLDEKFPTMESLMERAARYDPATGGEIVEFIYKD